MNPFNREVLHNLHVPADERGAHRSSPRPRNSLHKPWTGLSYLEVGRCRCLPQSFHAGVCIERSLQPAINRHTTRVHDTATREERTKGGEEKGEGRGRENRFQFERGNGVRGVSEVFSVPVLISSVGWTINCWFELLVEGYVVKETIHVPPSSGRGLYYYYTPPSIIIPAADSGDERATNEPISARMERLMIVACDLCANRPAKPLSSFRSSPSHPWLEKLFDF